MCTLRDKLWLFSSHSYLRSIDKKHQGVTALDITRHSYYKACRGPSDASVAYVYLKLNTKMHAFTHTQTLARLALELQRSSSAWIVDLGTHKRKCWFEEQWAVLPSIGNEYVQQKRFQE